MKIYVGRSGKNIGEYEFEYVREGLKKGLFLSSDFGWFAGLDEWQPLAAVLKSLSVFNSQQPTTRVPIGEKWRNDPASERQIKMLKRAGVLTSAAMTKGKASDLIAGLSEGYRSLTGKQIDQLKAAGVDLHNTPLQECRLVLEKH